MCRVKDRFPESVLVKVDHELLDKSELSEEKIKAHNKGFAYEVSYTDPVGISPKRLIDGRDKLTQLDRKILRYIKINAGVNLKNAFISLGVSYRRGNTIKNKLEGLGVIRSEKVCTDTGKEIQLYLTPEGKRYLQNTEDTRRLGGKWHQSAVTTVARYYQSRDFRVRLEYRDVDVFVDRGSEKIAIEVESLSGTKDIVNAVQNAIKALWLADRLEIVVKNRQAGTRLKKALNQSPLKNDRKIKIYQLDHYKL
jgi:predicted transcriptional regulator